MLDPRAPEHEISAQALHIIGLVRAHLSAYGTRSGTACTPQELAGTLNGIAVACQARPVAPDKNLSGRIARMLDGKWWKRNLRRELCLENESFEHGAGHVRRKGQCYVSDHAVRVKAARHKANRAVLEGLEVVNEDGQALNLAEVADASVSNPKLRRAELMVRCRGFEEVAAMMGHEAVFLTITCPSRFHRFNAAGKPNPNWDGSTPKDGQRYLCDLWARIRAKWNRAGIAPYGFRVAEPHHDGCPHWHILLFAPKHHIGWFVPHRVVAGRDDHGHGLVGIAGEHALRDSSGEAGAIKHRFSLERIDLSKGSATGYIAKYISKNIDGEKEDGEAIGLDFASGQTATDASKRVRSWASTWGIRQFQQIGGPSVTVWRELRRLAKDAEEAVVQLDLIEGPRSAADRSMWAMFWFLQGGPDVARRDLTLRPMYETEGVSKYGDAVTQVRGVLARDDDNGGLEYSQVTRLHTWTVQHVGQAATDATQAEWTSWRQTRARHADFFAAYDRIEAEKREGEAFAPWTGVNNCTDSNDGSTFASRTPDLDHNGETQPTTTNGGEEERDGNFNRGSCGAGLLSSGAPAAIYDQELWGGCSDGAAVSLRSSTN